MLAVLIIVIFVTINIGAERINIFSALDGSNLKDEAILFSSRLPRVLLAALVGMALASSGGAFQALLRNSLADPYILGVSGGAALGSVIAVLFNLPFIGVSALAFASAFLSMILIFAISKTGAHLSSHTLLLTGVIFNAFCFALILFINATTTMEQAYQIIFLLIGNLQSTGYGVIGAVGFFTIAGFIVLSLLGGKMNVLSLGDESASELGVNAYHLRIIVFIASSLMVGASVAVAGLVGFVGLFVPHAVRLIFGPDHRLLIPVSGLLGAAFLVVSDTAARVLLINTNYSTELPVGVITALIGAPSFMILLRRERWNR